MQDEQSLIFPFESVEKGSKIVLYGAGDVGQTFYWQLKRSNYCEITGWIDKCWDDADELEYPHKRLADLDSLVYDYIVIAVINPETADAIKKNLMERGITKDKIVFSGKYMIHFKLYQFGKILPKNKEKIDNIPAIVNNNDKTECLKIGFLTTGHSANTMAASINKRLNNAFIYAVSSRSPERAKAFAEKHNIPNAYGSYRELAEDPNINLVYISSPSAFHYEHVKLCLDHHKHVLCEKPFTLNLKQAEELVNLAKEKNLFLSDGMWTPYLPMAKKIQEVVQSGIIGKISSVTANQHYYGGPEARTRNLSLGGGAVLELGVYLLTFAILVLGTDIKKVKAESQMSKEGIDEQTTVVLFYDGAMAALNFGINAVSDRMGGIYGDKGYILVEDANEFKHIKVYDNSGAVVEEYSAESGYQYETTACVDAILQGKIETPVRPHDIMLLTKRVTDEIRRQIGVVYPADR
jgi:predicted dehydrogenase